MAARQRERLPTARRHSILTTSDKTPRANFMKQIARYLARHLPLLFIAIASSLLLGAPQASALSSVKTLSALTVNSGTLSPTFVSTTTAYTDSVVNATTSIKVTPTVTDSTATIKVKGTTVASGAASSAISLSVGDNAVSIVVTAQDATTQTYTVTVTRLPIPPVITNSSMPTALFGVAYSLQITASNTPTSYSATGLPSGLLASPTTGLISGTPTASGTFSVVLNATNAGGTGTGTFSFTVVGLGDAVNATAQTWTTLGTKTWFVESSTTHDGVYAAQSGAIPSGTTSNKALCYIQTVVPAASFPCTLKFWWKVSSAPTHYLSFTVDGVEQASAPKISGTVDWVQMTVNITQATSHTLRWIYAKDVAAAAGSDAAWLDQVTFSQVQPAITSASMTDAMLDR